ESLPVSWGGVVVLMIDKARFSRERQVSQPLNFRIASAYTLTSCARRHATLADEELGELSAQTRTNGLNEVG
ncbi:hypothetical protein DSI35_10000, partial [Mycobacterium tuberculosis]